MCGFDGKVKELRNPRLKEVVGTSTVYEDGEACVLDSTIDAECL